MDESLFRNRWVVAVLAGLGAMVLALVAARPDSIERRFAPPGSSYGFEAAGAAAYAELLDGAGYDITRVRTPVAERAPDTDSTVVVIDAFRLGRDDEAVLDAFVAAGGRLIVVTTEIGFLDLPAPVSRDPFLALQLFPHPELDGVGRLQTNGAGVWPDAGPLLPLYGDTASVVVAGAEIGAGRVYAVADGILSNTGLARADNAALGLAMAGGADRPVLFLEYPHGYTRSTGVAALPSRWRWALSGLLLAGVVWLIANGKRLGPPEDVERRLAPPRVRYVDALATGLSRSRDRAGATEPIRRRIESHLSRRGVSGDDMAALLAMDTSVVNKARSEPVTDQDVIDAGRVLARLERRTH